MSKASQIVVLCEDKAHEIFVKRFLTRGWGVKPRAIRVVVYPNGKGSGKQQKEYYEEAGFEMLYERATWEDGSNGVEAGLYEIRDLMRKGKFKIFSGLRDVFDEILQYHRDDKGKIVKVRDDLLDAIRYAYMMKRESIPYGDIMGDNSTEINFQSEW